MKIRVRKAWTPGWSASQGACLIELDGERVAGISRLGPSDHPSVDFDLPLTALPGLVDSHEHIGIDVGDERAQSFDDAGRILLRGAGNLHTIVQHGVTTIRDCGERADVEGYWIEALERGTIQGPRVIRSVTPVCRTGGHAWYLGDQADGPDAVRAAVRRQVRAGADFIKVMITGGLGTIGSTPTAPEYTRDEIAALIEEAHRLGRPVGGHAHGGSGVDDALDAGIDAVEHGIYLTEGQLARMAGQGTFLVATMGIGLAFESDLNVPAAVRAKTAGSWEAYQAAVRTAHRLGVRVAVGTDCVHGRVDREVTLLTELGFSPVEALTAATKAGADLAGRSDLGVLEPGAAGDIVFVDGDPTEDPSALERVQAVISRGRWAVPLLRTDKTR